MKTTEQNGNTSEDAKTAILHYIDDRLTEWAAWFKHDNRLGVGYPPCSVEYRLMTEGHVIRECIGLKPMPVHAAAEEMEDLMREMSAQHHKMTEVIKQYYLHEGGIRYNARKIGMSHANFEMHLNTARWWLAARLSMKGKIRELTQHFKQLQRFKQSC